MQIKASISSFTKLYLTCSFTLSLLVFFQLVDPYSITYTLTGTFFQLALWRPFTAILYLSRISWLLPFQLIFAYIATTKISTKVYQEQYANLTWFFLFSTIALMIFSTLISSLYFYGNSFIMIMFMTWATRHPTDFITLWKLDLHSVYFPIIYSTIMICLGSSYKNYMIGLIIGLIYGTLKGPTFIRQHGDFLPTPTFLKNYFAINLNEPNEKESINFIKESNKRQFFTGRAVQLN